ncbi:hypothetical protein LOTGIDRAFT_205331 [Lottia gigantea]|uniref:Syntaxin-8 n=1 Tax=Lottia gigantea TaxID=225164 RepID=V4A3Z7_LOTGI|nr:hypothetical protein LOTGIDRAFT_205331 [Lottia gigantea]ESO98633.1 hypothetical protein LOTGIDRAFT_205331 [Lottia gigantea]
MAGDSWLTEHDECSRKGQEIMEKINERNKHNRTSSQYTKLSAHVRSNMKQFSSSLNMLRQNLMRSSASYHITQREVERRQMLVDNLTSKEKQLDQAFRNESGAGSYVRSPGKGDRSSLLGGETFGANDPWGIGEEPDQFQGVTNSGLQAQQQSVIQEQDRGLDALSSVIARQKQMALDIGDEVDQQNILIDDITDHVDRTGERLIKETRHVNIVDKKSNTCCYWVIIVVLFITMIVIVAVPYNGKP